MFETKATSPWHRHDCGTLGGDRGARTDPMAMRSPQPGSGQVTSGGATANPEAAAALAGGRSGGRARRHYLDITELEWDWLEEVVTALSWEKPLWLDSRLLMEPLKSSEPMTSV